MSSGFHTEEESMIVSNQRFDSLLEFGIEVAAEIATSVDEQSFLERLRLKFRDNMYRGYDMLLDEEFSSLSEQLFWSKVYEDLSRRVLARKIANPDAPEDVRLSLAADATRLSRMLRS